MTSKYTLILFTILLATAAISGCTDADAPETLFNEQAIQKLLDDDTPISDIHDMIKPVAEQNNYDVDVVKSDSTGKIVSIGVDDGKGNHVRFIVDDANPDVDRATLNGKEIYPTTGNDDSVIRTAGGYTLDDLFDMARDDPEGFLDQEIEMYKLTGLGPQDSGKMLDGIGSDSILEWENPIPGIELYKELYNSNGKLKKITILENENNGMSFADKIKNNDEKGQDGSIDKLIYVINGEQTIINAE